MMAHGFSLGFLADLVREGLARERVDRTRMGNRELEVARLTITDEGQRSLDF